MFSEIFVGVFSGVLTTVLLFLAREFWIKTISPWYQSMRYKGADISGSWYAEQSFEDESKNVFSMVLEQSAHVVKGSLQFTYTSPQRKFNIDYAVVGEYWEGYLNLSCRSKDRRAYSQGAMFIKLIRNGTGLFGQFSFRDAATDQVTTVSIGLDRKMTTAG